MTVGPGTRLGPYEILAAIGAGGMGEVYKAKDTRLDRTVAIKVLLSHLSDNAERKQRFEREARAVSSLNHPHICTLHDIGQQEGVDFLVMEYLDGETLADRLKKGALPLDQALGYSIEIADALDKAHRQGVVHRDLKPGNIMLTKSGTKLLDFGLAKLRADASAETSSVLSALPTEEKPLTEKGSILGTFQYMAPEQLEGKEADSRTDIFAFGAVLYEMVTGRKAFEGKSQASLITSIMSSEPPPVSTVRPMSPPMLDHVVQRCLAKEPDERWQTTSDLMKDLKWIAEGASQAGVSEARGPSRNSLAWAVAWLVVGAIAAGVVFWSLMRPTEEVPRPVRRTVITFPPEAPHTTAQHFAISPDGSRIVYVSEIGGTRQLYVRLMNVLEPSPIPGTEGALKPFFSPNSEQVGFLAGDRLMKVSLNVGAPLEICRAPDTIRWAGATWTVDDAIIFSRGNGLSRVSATGGEPEILTTADAEQGELIHRYPHILPNGRALLFTIVMEDRSNRSAVQSLVTGERRILEKAAGFARYVPTGHLVYPRGETLVAAPFDLERLDVTGPEVSIGLEVPIAVTEFLEFSREGTLVYVPRGAGGMTLAWVDRQGRTEPLNLEPLAGYNHPRLSPDGRRLAVVRTPMPMSIWVYDLDGGQPPIRLTFEGDSRYPVWTPDGKRVAFGQVLATATNFLWTPADGTSFEPELLQSFELEQVRSRPWSCSPDGKELLLVSAKGASGHGDRDIWVLPLQENGTPRPILDSQFNERHPMIYPDGDLIAYVSDRSGRNEVWVRPYPDLEVMRPVQVSNNGGIEPLWSRDGRELFYLESDQVMGVSVDREPPLRFGTPQYLLPGPPSARGEFDFGYDVAPDGRFVMLREAGYSTESTYVVVVENWFEELKRLVPTKRDE